MWHMKSVHLEYLRYFVQYAKVFQINVAGFEGINNIVTAVFYKLTRKEDMMATFVFLNAMIYF